MLDTYLTDILKGVILTVVYCSIMLAITAEVSQILVSCKMPIYLEQFCLVYITITCSIWYFIQFVCIAIFMSLLGPAGACMLLVCLQFVYCQYNLHLSIVVHTNIVFFIYTHDPKQFTHQLGCKNELFDFLTSQISHFVCPPN